MVTVNDYPARRDSGWMGKIYNFLGLTTGCIVHGIEDDERRQAYAADVTYGTNNEFGFDYLRDNMKFASSDLVQRSFNFAIVDEVDSILIDEARTPLIISGPAEDSSELYMKIDAVVPHLADSDFEKDEKSRTVVLTEVGNETIERLLGEAGLLVPGGGMYDAQNVQVVHHVNQALRAHKLFTRDVDYIVKGGKVIIIDEFTGRHDGRPPLFRRPASGAGSQRTCANPAREPDAGQHHLPELFPPVPETCGHDRHSPYRSGRILRDLRAGSGGNSPPM